MAGYWTIAGLIGEVTDQPFVLPGHVDRSHLIVLKMK